MTAEREKLDLILVLTMCIAVLLLQEANLKVQEANIKRMNVEKRLEDADHKVRLWTFGLPCTHAFSVPSAITTASNKQYKCGQLFADPFVMTA